MGGKRRLGSTARCADQLGPTAPCSSAAGWTAASSARSARACTGAGHPPSLACLLALAFHAALSFVRSSKGKGRMQEYLSLTYKDTNFRLAAPLCWDGRRREGLLRRGLGGREHRNQPQVRRPRRHEPTRSTAHTHAHTRTHARARTHAHAHHTPNARTGRATCCSSTSDA